MKNRAGFFIALRYLWGRAHEGGRYLRGAAAGIAVSLIPIIVTLIVADGMIRGILDRYLELGTGHLQVFNAMNHRDIEGSIPSINEIEGVRGAWPEQRSIGVLVGSAGRTGAAIRAVEPSFWEDPGSAYYLEVIEGSARLEGDREMLLGHSLADSIGAAVGDTVRLMTIRTSAGGGSIPTITPFVVRGVVSSGYHELDALWSIITWESGLEILCPTLSTASLLVKIDEPYREANYFAWSIRSVLGAGFSVFTWMDLLRAQYNSYEATRQLLLFIMALIVIVAAVNVSFATSMLVLERQRDIAVLKVNGAGVRGVTGIFLWGSFLTGLLGAVLGIGLGLLIGKNINPIIRSLEALLTFFSALFQGGAVVILDRDFYLETIPIIIDWNLVLLIGCFTVFCSVAASWIPARRAGKLKPMELLRKL
ncbi:MAG: FtsX-like permease family protein [Spirochaetes bacterium]|nr:FtsX-like permease family protein [Spirochaetota bacterium]